MCSGRRGAPARPSTAGGRIVAHSPDAVVRPKEPSLVGAFLFRWFDDPCVEPPRASTRVWVSSESARRKSTVRKTLTSDRVLPFRHPSSSKLNSLQLPSGVWIPADFLVWGFFCQGGVSRGDRSRIFSFVSFFVRSESRFFVPTRTSPALACAEAVKVGRRTNHTTGSAVARPHLDSFEHDGTVGAIGITIGGELACGRDQSRHNLVFGGSKDPNHDAVIRIGSEAPKRRTHSPFRH